MQEVKKSGAKIILITANRDSVLTRLSNNQIILPNKEHDDRIATFYSHLAFNYILTVIYALLHKKVEL